MIFHFQILLNPFLHQSVLLQTITYSAKRKQYVCQEMKDQDTNGNGEKLHAASETEGNVWKHRDCAGNTDRCCSMCQRADGIIPVSMSHHFHYQEKKTEARGGKILSLTSAQVSAKLSQ